MDIFSDTVKKKNHETTNYIFMIVLGKKSNPHTRHTRTQGPKFTCFYLLFWVHVCRGVALRGVAWCGVGWCDMIGLVCSGVTWCGAMLHGEAWCGKEKQGVMWRGVGSPT